MTDIDPRLNRHLLYANEQMLIDAIVIVMEDDRDPLEAQSDRGLGEQVIQQVAQQTDQTPTSIRYIPGANAVALTAHPSFIRTLLRHPHVQIASAATIDSLHF